MAKITEEHKFLDLSEPTDKPEPKKKVTHYLLVLDKSGSMDSVRESTIVGFNENVQTIKDLVKKYPDQEYFVSLVTFNYESETVLWRKPASELSELTSDSYQPNGGTALYDALGNSVTRLRGEIAEDLKDPEVKVVVSVFTDGAENASKEYNGTAIANLSQDVQDTKQWMITYIGANHDVAAVAKSLNIPLSNTVAYTSDVHGTQSAFKMSSEGFKKYSYNRSVDLYNESKMYSDTEAVSDITNGKTEAIEALTKSITENELKLKSNQQKLAKDDSQV